VLHAFSSLSIPSHITPYSVLLSYPVHRSLSLSAGPGRAAKSFSLTQDTYPSDPYARAAAEVTPTFFAYSASGSVSAEAVYANYGREEDFAYLSSRGVDVAGRVALARYGRIHCEDIVHNARAAGAAAALVYPDPLEYGGSAGEGSFPDSRWLPPSGVQVGSLFRGVGDPTTPMWASSEGCERGNDTMATIENVFAVIEGAEEPDSTSRYLKVLRPHPLYISKTICHPGKPSRCLDIRSRRPQQRNSSYDRVSAKVFDAAKARMETSENHHFL
uniref:PA domain-containing protein n=1 Tax=Aegilops tauschii subsp. strangulata TaxID=200361 RepID=A0A453FG04_AEGTS